MSSRIDDDGAADAAAQRAAEQRRLLEQRQKEGATQDSAFRQLVQRQASDRAQTEDRKSAVEALLEEVNAQSEDEDTRTEAQGRNQQRKFKTSLGTAAFDKKVRAGSERDTDRGLHAKASDVADDEATVLEHGRKLSDKDARAESEGEDGKRSEQGDKDRAKGMARAGASKSAGKADELKADRDGGKKGGDKGSQDQGGSGGAPAGFRFNPALAAPVPVAQPRDMARSDRLRAVANEIAQRIVERVRVGNNAAGQAEFQIDLRSNVLKGLSIKVSGSKGRIKALFSGSDREVLKMLEDQSNALKSALSGRGLDLVELKFEARA